MAALSSQALLSAVGVAHASAPLEEDMERPGLQRQNSVVRNMVESVEAVLGGLVELGVPRGLAEVIATDDARIGRRIYLLDNSGSMNTSDGSVLRDAGQGRMKLVRGTRWQEICAFARDHAQYNLKVGTPAEFVLLNAYGRLPWTPMQEGADFVCIDRALGEESAQLERLERLLKDHGPRGVTPMAQRLEEIVYRVKEEAGGLSKRGQMVFLTIATDGLPTSTMCGQSTPGDQRQLVEQLRCLGAALPVQLVIRLCTNDKDTIDFYNSIDEELEFPLDVLDDICGEAEEIVRGKGNHWFSYTPLLHRIREAGTLCRVLDTIDERPLHRDEIRQLAELLTSSPGPLNALSDRQFVYEIKQLVRKTPLVFDAFTQQMRPVIHVGRLRAALRVGCRGWFTSVLLRCLKFLDAQ